MSSGGAPGFSLVEMLVVVAVVSVLAVGASLPLARAGGSAQADAARLVAAAARLRDLALVSGKAHALAVRPEGWTEERRGSAGWEPIGPPQRFRSARLAGADGERLVLLPDGQSGAVRLRLEGRGAVDCRAGPAPLSCTGG